MEHFNWYACGFELDVALHLTDSIYSQAINKLLHELSPQKEHFALNRLQKEKPSHKKIAVAQDVETSGKGKGWPTTEG